MTSTNETVSRQNLRAGNIAKSMTSEGKIALLRANVGQRSLPAFNITGVKSKLNYIEILGKQN